MSFSLRHSLILVAALAAGCAQEQPPINRVQPDYFDKAFFVGADYLNPADDPEYYSQATLVDVGYGAGQDGLFTSTYAQPLTRVRWTIQEDLLIARLAYERVKNSDGKGAGKATNDGIVVAAYRIEKHFDVARSYNPSTGEQLNVVEENSYDRPWYQRQYIRVDWSKNLSTDNYDFDTLSQVGVYGGITYEPLAYYVNDPTHPDAPRYVPDEGYLDVTNKAFARPQLIDISSFGWGMSTIPACWLEADYFSGTAPATGCSPVEITVRQSFRRVVDNDYEPADWDGHRFKAFGAFTTDRYGYARNYGMTDAQWYRFINRYNLWERNHFYQDPAAMTGERACFTPQTTPAGKDPHRDENLDGTEDECASVGRGSRCDTFRQRCTLPFRDRKAVVIPWFFANGGNQDYFEPTAQATHEWDVVLRSSIMTARYTECARTGGGNCEASYPVYHGQQNENDDAIALAQEVDDCRSGRAYAGRNCEQVADEVGAARGYSAGVIALAKMPEVLVLCHSPVEAGDHVACGEPRLPQGLTAARCNELYEQGGDEQQLAACHAAKNVRRGDLRYHQVNAIKQPQTPSPWGIMVDSNDPLTGESIAASINTWTHVNDLWSQGIVDTARYIKGELTTAEVTEGSYIFDWAKASEAASRGGALGQLTEEEFLQRLGDIAGVSAEQVRQLRKEGAKNNPALAKEIKKVARALGNVKADALAPSQMKPIYEARRQRARGTATEAALTTPMMQSYAGTAGLPSSEAVLNLASPLRGANPEVAADLYRRRQLALADEGACVLDEAPVPFSIADLADMLESKFGAFDPNLSKDAQLAKAERMRRYLAQRAHYSVTTHEMGHSVGLRHNFVSSSDAFNYRPQYWQLRTKNGTQLTPCLGLNVNGGCTGPRYFDPVTDEERKNFIYMFMQSSTMDYAGEATQDLIGLGAYDFAAARMFYGDVVSTALDPSYAAGTARGAGLLEKMDSFGGILGIQYSVGVSNNPTDTQTIHYSQLQTEFELIGGCQVVDPLVFKPARWDDNASGAWHPTFDGMIVQVNGAFSRCKSQPVDYANWSSLRAADATEVASPDGLSAVDVNDRVRWPYGFGTDRWADLGNVSVYRHDNGADPYELFDFLITQQEVNHIFDNYRRGRQTFSVRNASNRALGRYHEKLRDAAKGVGLMANVYREFAANMAWDFDTAWSYLAGFFFPDSLLASGLGFDHITKLLSRPEPGPHYITFAGFSGNARVLRSMTDTIGLGENDTSRLVVPNGATGLFRNVVPGGRPVENALAEDKGEYDSEYVVNAGSYYEKAWTAMLMTESVDNFISDSRMDFTDARYRAISLADLYPDGYRRWLANNLTGDVELKGPRVEVDVQNNPLVDAATQTPLRGLGWVSWWRQTPQACFVGADNIQCGSTTSSTMAVDPQVNWEQQKFLIASTLQYLPENAQQTWLNMLGLWELGADSDPGFPNRIELHLPNGKVYVAKTFGKETLFGKTVQKGIAARMLEYANELMATAYVTTNGPDLDGNSQPDWVVPSLGANGQPMIRFDPAMTIVTPDGYLGYNGRPGCNATDNSQCTCASNRACVALSRYEELPFFLRQAMRDYGLADPSMRGIY